MSGHNGSEPPSGSWIWLLHSCRWPFTVLATTGLLVSSAGRLLKHPIPVRITGGVNLDKVAHPIEVSSGAPLQVQGSVAVANERAIPVTADDVVVRQPITVQTSTSIPVTASQPIPVRAEEVIAVAASQPIPVHAPEAIEVSTGGPVTARVMVDSVNTPLVIEADQPLPVEGTLDIARIKAPLRVNARGRLFPFRLP